VHRAPGNADGRFVGRRDRLARRLGARRPAQRPGARARGEAHGHRRRLGLERREGRQALGPSGRPATASEIVPPAAPFARQIALRPRSAPAEAAAAATVVSFDAEGRVVRLEAFADESRTALLATLSFESPVEAVSGAWLFGREVFETAIDGRPVRTVSRFDRLRVNEELPPSVFDPKAFF